MTDPWEVIQTLQKAQVRFVLMGTHGIGGYRSEPRATQDVDVLVTKKDHARAIHALREAFPKLQVFDTRVVTRFKESDSAPSVIDVMKPTQDIFRVAFRNSVTVQESYRIPTLEMALASKFAAMTSPNREYEKKLIDGGDFVNIVKKNHAELDLKKLGSLGDRVYPKGGMELLKMVADVIAGKRIDF